MSELGLGKLVCVCGGGGETSYDYLRRVDAYALLGDEKTIFVLETIWKALLGLVHRISVTDSLSEEDKKTVKNFKAALLFGQCFRRIRRHHRTKPAAVPDKTEARRALFKTAYALSPGQSSDDEMVDFTAVFRSMTKCHIRRRTVITSGARSAERSSFLLEGQN